MRQKWVEVFIVLALVGVVSTTLFRSDALKKPSVLAESPLPMSISEPVATPESDALPEPSSGRMWEPFTEASRKGIVGAQEVAEKEKMKLMDCRHLVLGLAEADPRIQDYLTLRKVKFPERKPASSEGEGDMAFSQDGKRAIELAFEQVRSEKSDHIDSIHLFMGILKMDSETRKTLNAYGATFEDFKAWLKKREAQGK